MLLQEFIDRTGIEVSAEEFERIHDLYMATTLDKDTFCKDFKKHKVYESEIVRNLYERVQVSETALSSCNDRENDLAELLIGKSRVYNDTDFRNAAIKLIGEKGVVLMTVEMNRPLWEEDKEYILNNLNRL